MKIEATQPDVSTIVNRIDHGDINLRPEFQRGEVWSLAKKQKLIDSILRYWHVPPIHVIVDETTQIQDVLDGLQRLISICDFTHGKIMVDGNIEPLDDRIMKLDGLTYYQLPEITRRSFDSFPITVYKISDYTPEEPGELFYRLNQPVSLTAAEQRNAFFGVARGQIKKLVSALDLYGINKEYIGFSNARMAYDDVIARLCYALERETIRAKISAAMLADKYRSNEPFPAPIIDKVDHAIQVLGNAIPRVRVKIKLNRASLFSWLLFIIEINNVEDSECNQTVGDYISFFETNRIAWQQVDSVRPDERIKNIFTGSLPATMAFWFFDTYDDMSSSRSTDAVSLVSRDLILWIWYYYFRLSNRMTIKPKYPYTLLQDFIGEIESAKNQYRAFSYLEDFRSTSQWDIVK